MTVPIQHADDLASLARRFRAHADAVDQLTGRLAAGPDARVKWQGPAALAFNEDVIGWQTIHGALADDFRATAANLEREARRVLDEATPQVACPPGPVPVATPGPSPRPPAGE